MAMSAGFEASIELCVSTGEAHLRLLRLRERDLERFDPEVLDFLRSGRETDFLVGDLDLWRLRRLERPLLGETGETELWTGLSAGAASSLTVLLGTGAGAGSAMGTGVGSGSLLVFRVELEL